MRTLYLGLEPSTDWLEGRDVVHCPLIQIVPRPLAEVSEAFHQVPSCTHLLFTSKSAVKIFCTYYPQCGITQDQIKSKQILAIGKKTAEALTKQGLHVSAVSKTETSEGVIEAFQSLFSPTDLIFWPHSALSRSVIPTFFHQNNLPWIECVLYNTITYHPDPLPSLDEFDEIIFTSPSTIEAFLEVFGSIPPHKKLKCIGPITQAHLESKINFSMQS